MPEFVEEEPPSYQHAFQAGLDEDSVVHEFGRFKDTSLDSFERGELFVQAFRSQINGAVPPELVEQVRQHGLQSVQRLDQTTHSNSLFKHPLATANQPPFHITTMSGDDSLTPIVEFWPRLRNRGNDMDWDITLQATHPYLVSYGEGDDKVHSLHYFEITVQEAKSDVVLSIGLSTKPYPLFRMPGWNNHSIGYHSDDGRKFIDDASGGQDYGPSWKKGDTVGCGYSPTEGNVFFTKNGQMLGIAYSSISPLNYYASLAADGHAKVNVNFGTRPFLYYPPPPPPSSSFSYPPPPL
ncbi:concanavalin A-like lectin/glucanase domain-containing protein [Zychaea mexicana]|uniref:concanavalin A-like lectin/glucanase domain-containing protein n=1 Tax=Zychaea mexicana TaxID=64656 RepID=UPI0022FDE888|nr:concanavalin A-like lectin/glucanase domain-containing protein [Zychaea mexicana]KAI9488507.1 concanavalin A-like lectin/glucanase domain-containing protein [Zychaea mexicana]